MVGVTDWQRDHATASLTSIDGGSNGLIAHFWVITRSTAIAYAGLDLLDL
jgi:hypothetical protein